MKNILNRKNKSAIMTEEFKKIREADLWSRVGSIQSLHFSVNFSKINTTQPSYIYKKSGTIKYLKALFSRPSFVVGFLIILVIIMLAIIAPELAPFTFRGRQLPPRPDGLDIEWNDTPNLSLGEYGTGSSLHLFGTDSVGQDLWAQVWYGTRNTLAIAFSVVAVTLLAGTIIGLIIGYFKLADWFFQRIIKVVSNIPVLIILAVMSALLGRTIEGLIIAFILFSWLGMALQVRAQVFRVRNLDYNKASRIMGSSTVYIFMKNILPAALPIVITNLMFIIPSTILSEATLGFIGLSLDPLLSTTLGSIISANTQNIIQIPRLLIIPGLVLFFITSGTVLMGDAINRVNREGAR